jgi:hypothetical protein
MKAPSSGSTTLACPSCSQPVEVPLRITSESRRDGATLHVAVDESFMQTFERHVLADPAAHPDFMLVEDDERADDGAAR